MAFMILVNNAGDWSHVYAPLEHAQWNGLTPTDCIFPVFMFIMGFSIFLSLRSREFKLDGKLFFKILKRTVLLFFLGILISLPIGLLTHHVTFMGVLQRFAICYFVVAVLSCLVNQESFPWIAAGLLAVYSVLLLVGNGFANDSTSILAKVDNAILGSHSNGENLGPDSEGILSTISAIAHVMIGFCAARLFFRDKTEGVRNLLIMGSILIIAGLLLQYLLPLNKKVWSPSFVLFTTGVGSTVLALLIWAIDEKGYIRHTGFFKVFGTNSILCYLLSFLSLYLFMFIPVAGNSISGWINTGVCTLFGHGCLASMMYAVVIVLIVWACVYPLYRKEKYIKL